MTDLSGKGALAEEDLLVYRCGLGVILPDTAEGEPVMYWDRPRADGIINLESRDRVLFFLIQNISMNTLSQKNGIVCLWSTRKKMGHFQSSAGMRGLELLQKSFPVKLKRVHLLSCPTDKATFLDRMKPMLMKHIVNFVSGFTLEVHVADNKLEMFDILMTWGFSSESLPETLGGSWSFQQDFLEWSKDRGLIEEDSLFSSSLAHFDDISEAVSGQKRSAPLPEDSEQAEVSEEESKALAKKNMGVIYSRRKRMRQKIRVANLVEESENLRVTNESLKLEQARLETLLQAANQEVARSNPLAGLAVHRTPSLASSKLMSMGQAPISSLEDQILKQALLERLNQDRTLALRALEQDVSPMDSNALAAIRLHVANMNQHAPHFSTDDRISSLRGIGQLKNDNDLWAASMPDASLLRTDVLSDKEKLIRSVLLQQARMNAAPRF